MRKVRCYECGKQYDYDEDGFCPACGAFNQPPRAARIRADGAVVRVDGINERNHGKSFVHQELHEEDRERRRVGMEKGTQRFRAVPHAAVSRPQKGQKNTMGIVVGIIFGIIALNILANFLYIFF